MQSLTVVLKLVAEPARRVPPPVQAARQRIQVWLLKEKAVVLVQIVGPTPLLDMLYYVKYMLLPYFASFFLKKTETCILKRLKLFNEKEE